MFKNNPIFFKDLLIALNSRQGKVVIFFFIFIYFIAFLLFLAEIKLDYNFYRISGIGKGLFQLVGLTQLVVLVGFSFFRGLLTFTTEKTNKTLDFITISPISSAKFILGKFLAAMSFVMLLFIIALPFVSMGVVLGGVNIIDVYIYSLYTLIYSSCAVLLGMAISSFSKNTVFSILYGIFLVPLTIFFIAFFLVYTTDYLGFEIIHHGTKSFVYGIFPVSVFDYVAVEDKYINFYGIKIHYLLFSILFYGLINSLLVSFLLNQYKKFTKKSVQSFNYLSTFLLTLICVLCSYIFNSGLFGLTVTWSIFSYLLYLVNNSGQKEIEATRNKYIYFGVTFIISTGILLINYGFIINSIGILFLILLLLFTFHSFLQRIFRKTTPGIINTIYILILALFFYIIPLLFTNLLNIQFNTVNSVIKTAIYNDRLHDITCIKNIDWKYKCKGIKREGVSFYYFLYILLNVIFILSSIAMKRKKHIGEIENPQ